MPYIQVQWSANGIRVVTSFAYDDRVKVQVIADVIKPGHAGMNDVIRDLGTNASIFFNLLRMTLLLQHHTKLFRIRQVCFSHDTCLPVSYLETYLNEPTFG